MLEENKGHKLDARRKDREEERRDQPRRNSMDQEVKETGIGLYLEVEEAANERDKQKFLHQQDCNSHLSM